MARRTIVRLLDDLDGKDAAESIQFAFDGFVYEIDLTDENAKRMRAALSYYAGAARRLGRFSPSIAIRATQSAPLSPKADKAQNAAIRAWAKRRGIEVNYRGRIAQQIVDQYHAEAGRRPKATVEIPEEVPEGVVAVDGLSSVAG